MRALALVVLLALPARAQAQTSTTCPDQLQQTARALDLTLQDLRRWRDYAERLEAVVDAPETPDRPALPSWVPWVIGGAAAVAFAGGVAVGAAVAP